MVLRVKVKAPTTQTQKSGKTFDIFGRGHSKDSATRDLSLAVRDTERALGLKLGSPLETSVQVVLTAAGKRKGIGTGSDYETARAQAEQFTEGAKVKYEGVTLCNTYMLEGQAGEAEPTPVVRGSGGGADYKDSQRSATGLF